MNSQVVNNVFDFVNAITWTKDDIINDYNEKLYLPFIVNRHMSYFIDSVLVANEMNQYSGLSNKAQFDFYKNVIRKKRRYYKWPKIDNDLMKKLGENNISPKLGKQWIDVCGIDNVNAILSVEEKNDKHKQHGRNKTG